MSRRIQERRGAGAADWLAIPVERTNAAAVATTAALMLFLADYHPDDVEAVEFMRANAVVLIAAYAAWHIVTLNSLKFLELLEVAEAKPALARYRDPRRVSHLDLAAAWLGFYALVPYAGVAT
jgi:hypothetical protein